MAKRRDYRLSEADLKELEEAIRRDKRPGVRQRAIVVRLLHLGYPAEEIAEMQAISKPTVYACYHRWEEGGIDGLADKPRSGRPPKITEAYREKLREVVEQEPSAYGYDFAVWTIGRLRAHLAKETGIELSESRMGVLLKEEGYRYRRPKHDLSHLQDKEAKDKAREMLEALKKGRPKQEFGFSLWTKRQ
ncbi:MAG: IS630 family transposase [Chloroflexi bacterium]|nr:IS630 family transposase [Chloroflexota bacterium]